MAQAKVPKTAAQAKTGRQKKTATAAPRTIAGAARSLSPPEAGAAGGVDVDQVLASIANARAALVEIKRKLNSISEAALDRLSKAEQEAWADELAQTSNAIVVLDTAALKIVNDDFARRVPELEQKTRALAESLQKMRDAVDIIASVGKVIQIVTDIASLIK